MIAVLDHHAAILARLAEATFLSVYDAYVPDTPPRDSDGVIHGYAVLYVGAGPTPPVNLAHDHGDTDMPFQVTVAAGDAVRALRAVDKVLDLMLGWRPTIAGRTLAPVRADSDSGPLRRDDAITPPRFYLPLMFRVQSIPA